MELFIPDLKKAGGRFLSYRGGIEIKNPGMGIPRENVTPLRILLKAAYVNNRVLIKGSWQAELTGECSRCLEQTSVTLEESFDEEFIHLQAGEGGKTMDTVAELDEQLLFKGEQLKLDEYFKHSFLLSQPLKILCREDCKGLCQICGCNKNVSSCSCVDESIDQRWTPLKKLY